MDAKQYLQQIKLARNIIESKREQLQNLRDMSTSIAGIDYSKEQVQSSDGSEQISKAVAKIVDIEKELNEDIVRYTELYGEINSRIQEMVDIELKALLIDRYMNFMTFELIAEKRDCTTRWAYELHHRALSAFAINRQIA